MLSAPVRSRRDEVRVPLSDLGRRCSLTVCRGWIKRWVVGITGKMVQVSEPIGVQEYSLCFAFADGGCVVIYSGDAKHPDHVPKANILKTVFMS